MYEGLTIGYILEFLRALLQDRAKDILRAKTSDERAKILSFQLYKQLRLVVDHSNQYVGSLSLLVAALRQEVSSAIRGSKEFARTAEGSDIVRKAEAVNQRADMLADEMAELQERLEEMSPQLEIYKPRVVDDILGFKGDRDGTVHAVAEKTQEIVKRVRWRFEPEHLKSEWPRYLLTCRDDLWDLYVQARENQSKIEEACRDFQSFLEVEFTFKESF